MDMNIEVNNLCKSLNEFKLDNITFNVPKGKIVGIIGENGAGKTTLIKTILDIMKKDSGEVKIFGKQLTKELKEDIGVVFDNSFINQKYNVKDINLMMKYIHKSWDENKFFNLIKEYNIPLNRELKKVSTGMKKKIEIITILSYQPKLLILDEPTSGLDPIIRSDILDMFQDYVKNGNNSILLSTHITSDLETISDIVLFISDGKIIFEDELDNIHNKYILLNIPKNDFNKINKDIIIRYKENKNNYQVLIDKKDLDKAITKYQTVTTLDNIMLLYVRGKVC